jgi:hypothetical protein
MNPHELLNQAANIISARGEGYGGIENNFQLTADLASLRLGREFHPYEIAVILACVKNARAFASPAHLDSHIDAVNYELFAATFADDYMASKAGAEHIEYKKKADRKPKVMAEKLVDLAEIR